MLFLQSTALVEVWRYLAAKAASELDGEGVVEDNLRERIKSSLAQDCMMVFLLDLSQTGELSLMHRWSLQKILTSLSLLQSSRVTYLCFAAASALACIHSSMAVVLTMPPPAQASLPRPRWSMTLTAIVCSRCACYGRACVPAAAGRTTADSSRQCLSSCGAASAQWWCWGFWGAAAAFKPGVRWLAVFEVDEVRQRQLRAEPLLAVKGCAAGSRVCGFCR